jgi:hypothetical protein
MIALRVEYAKLHGCDALMQNFREHAATSGFFQGSTWLLDGDHPFELHNYTDRFRTRGQPCELRVKIKRNPASFFVREILTLICVCQLALLSLRLHPATETRV